MASDMGVELARLDRRVAELERNRTFRNVSIDGTTLPVYDADGVLRQTIGVQDDGSYTVVDFNAPPPPMPSSPTVQSTIGGLVVVWDGLTATGEPWPRDFKHVEVHLAAVGDYEATNETQVGTLISLLGGGWTIGGLEPGLIYYASLVAVNTSGKESARTPITVQTSGTIGVAVDQAVLDQAQAATDQAIQNVRNRPRAYYGAIDPAAPASVAFRAPTAPVLPKIIGATAEFGMWPDVLAGAGADRLNARRHYPILVTSGKNKSADIEDSVANGRMPVISYKPPTLEGQTAPDTAGLLAGTYDAMIAATRDYLVSLNHPVTVSFWHEPHNEITPADYIAGATKFLDIFGEHPNIAHGPILNGFLLDSVADRVKFEAFIPESLLSRWDFVAVDTYQNGTNAAPGTKLPARAAPALVDMLTLHGHPDMPIGIGEYNGLTPEAIAQAGETFLSTPTLWFALLWVGVANSNGVDWTMTTAEWDAFKATKSDPRALGVPAPDGGFVSGDQWWRQELDELGQVSYAGFQWDPGLNGGAGGWASYQFGGSALVADSISAAHILADAIQTIHIASQAIYGEHIVGEQIETAHLGAKAVTADKLAAALVIATKISTGATDADGNLIGQRSELGPEGIKNIGADGQPNLYFPNDPNDAGFIRAALETWQLRVRGGLAVESSNNEFAADSVTALSAGVSAPQQAALIESTWDSVAMDTTTSVRAPLEARSFGDFGSFRFDPSQVTGFAYHSGVGKWVVAQQRAEGTRQWFFNEDGTVAQTLFGPWVADYSNFYEMSIAGEAADGKPIMLFRQGADWLVHGPVGGTYRFNKLPAGWRLNGSQRPFVAWDKVNSRVLIAENHNAGAADNLVIRRVSLVNTDFGVCTLPAVVTGYLASGRAGAVSGLTFGPEVATANHYVSVSANGMETLVMTSAGADANAAHRWPLAALPRGFAHNGTVFKSLADDGRLYTYTDWTWTDTRDKIYSRYTWYDSGRGNGIIHETKLGQVASITAKKRSKVRITVPVVPNKNGVDDPDKFRLYAARASAEPGRIDLPRIFEGPPVPTTTPTSVIVTSDPSSTDFAPDDPNPYDFPGANPARFHSGMVDAYGRRKFEVDGFGLGRWPRIMPVGTVLDWTGGGTPPEGWLFADGTAASRTGYPELAALYWEGTAYRYGDGDGTTTFNLPLLAGGYADLSSINVVTAATGFKVISQSFQRRGPIVSAAFGLQVISSIPFGSVDHSNQLVATIGAGWRPASDENVPSNGDGLRTAFIRASDGAVVLQAGLATYTNSDLLDGANLVFGTTYMLPVDTTTGRRVRKIIYAGGNT